ncbi:hypothetical protein CROQUDRAFT_136957 [Cronartium quercuum f. sp. fusiforme G11]|uniref:tRNA pseudouridine synthase 1 n=1 Tax=Cronartium quercuum f. sp. fusiforme G11 TaxID=708437 RepID=A0A9P6T5Z8_9BASI|nr:hypothetical protein CROQUDRAFT_136957 [Cronartium quercuum f. sp. fusiforme G11]
MSDFNTSESTSTINNQSPSSHINSNKKLKSDIDVVLARNQKQKTELINQNNSNDETTSSKSTTNRRQNENSDNKRKNNWSEENKTNIKIIKTNEKRLPKRKVAVLFGYYGKGYKGSQVNPGMKTIEGEIFKAFVKAGCISQDNSLHPQKVGLQRAARTDANVHAGCNLISLKLILEPPNLNKETDNKIVQEDQTIEHHSVPLINYINSFLPNEIRLWSFNRVQNSFHARTMCDSRTYEYSLPTYLFLPPKPGTALYNRLNSIKLGLNESKWSESFDPDEHEGNWWNDHLDQNLAINSEILQPISNFKLSVKQKKSEYRISLPMIKRIKESIEKFKGTHNFHNFTVGKEFKERNSIRIIREMSVSEPFIVGNEDEGETGTEWISIKFYGQSFMLHQIRKMMGLIILLCRTRTPSTLIPELYGPIKVRIPKAPGLGLILQNPHFDGYNKRIIEFNQTHQNKPIHEDLIREIINPNKFLKLIEKFKKEILYKKMWEEEKNENGFGVWINYLDVCNESDLDFINPKGVLPPSITNPKSSISNSSKVTTGNQTNVERLIDSDEEDLKYQDGEEIEEG